MMKSIHGERTRRAFGLRPSVCGLLFLLALGGCGDGVSMEPVPPAPPDPMNAQLQGGQPIWIDLAGSGVGDTVVVGRIVAQEEYARTKMNDNWFTVWYVIRVEMISREKGQWDKPMGPESPDGKPAPVGLSFVVRDSEPTPEAAEYIDYAKTPWPYQPGFVYAFALDTTTTPATIAGQEFLREEPSPPDPIPPEPMNAELPGHQVIEDDVQGDGDTVMVGRVVDMERYARTWAGNWVTDWYVIRVEMVSLEKGQWDKRIDVGMPRPSRVRPIGLTFVVKDTWPTPESRVVTSPRMWPYDPDNILVFTLDTTVTPARIVGQEYRGPE